CQRSSYRDTMAAESTLALSLVEEFVSGLQDSKAKDAAKGVKDGKFTVLQLVEALGSSLTSSQPHTRARGVHLLSEVLQECYGDLTEREVLIAFYENRLKDHYVVTPPVLKGLKALTKCTNLPPGSAVSMLRSVFQDIHVQCLSQLCCKTHFFFFSFFSHDVSLLRFPTELKGLGADFVFGFVQSMDGERDPRNLLLAFQIAKNLIHGGYDLGKFTEELFEVTSCYFPIDFSPPPNDPHGITREELVQALRAVLTGTPKFAEFLLPLLIEKLDSDVQSAKLDSLQTLVRNSCLAVCLQLKQELTGLWTSVRREVFQTSSEKIESAGLAALTALTSCLSRSVLSSDSEDSLSTFLDFILKDCKHHLCEPDLKLVWPSAKLLQAACSASTRASHIITVAVMPSLLEQYNNRTQVIETADPMNQDQEEVSELHSHHAVRQRCLSALAAVSIQPSVVQESTPVLLEVLRSAHTGNLAKKMLFLASSVVLTCRSLQRIAERVQDSEEAGRCFHDVFIPHLLSLALQAFVSVFFFFVNAFDLFAQCRAYFLMRCVWLPFRLAGQTASRAVSLFLDGDVSFLPDNSFPSHMQLLKGDSWSLSRLVCLLMGSVCSLPRSVEVPQIDKLLSALEEMSCACSHPLSYTSAAKCFAGLVNKKPQGDSLDSCACPQVAKALLLRYHPLFTTLTDKLFSLLDDADLGPMAADGFSLLMSDSTDVLNRACHADVRIMYRQRFFSENSAKLVQGFNAAPQEKKPNYLKALSNIVNKLPKQVQVTELPALLSLLLEALSCPDQDIHLSTLSCLEPVLVNPPQVLIQQLEALINRLLALISSPAMSVRIASLSCISTLSHFPVLPFRARVLRALAKPLDDKKRLVRREAVQARGEWFLLGSPGGR
uniref:MMS19 nucleotide excision repair protein n=1 Tax=Oreochromis niloticus TaxID=8128 RepID=A0A669DYB9_ORENI